MKVATCILALVVAVGCQSASVSSSSCPVPRALCSAYPSVGFGTVTKNPLPKTEARKLTIDDVRQIVALAERRPDIRRPVSGIYFTRSDRAEVSAMPQPNPDNQVTGFDVRKDNGVWKVIPGSVYQTTFIVTP